MGSNWDYAVVYGQGGEWVLEDPDAEEGVSLGESMTAMLRKMGADGWDLEHLRPGRVQKSGNMIRTEHERLIFKRPLLDD